MDLRQIFSMIITCCFAIAIFKLNERHESANFDGISISFSSAIIARGIDLFDVAFLEVAFVELSCLLFISLICLLFEAD